MKIKKIVLVLICLVCALMPIKVSAQEGTSYRFDSWKNETIISPEAGELKASGEILVKFKSMDIDNIKVDHYELYIDGSKVKSVRDNGEKIIESSVYLTQTDYYSLQVVAITESNHEISSNIRKFMISKKGLNIDDKAVLAPESDMQESWYYNWGVEPSDKVDESKEYVPMIWNSNTVSWLESEEKDNYSVVLGFNEPDLENQANMTVEEAASYQKMFSESGLRVGSAVTTYPLNEWYQEYAQTIDMDEVDFIPVHIYYDWAGDGMAEAFLEAIDNLYETYHKPIWVTEFGIANPGLYGANSNYKEAKKQIATYLKETIAGLEARDYVERYTWFNFSVNDASGGKTALYDQESGELTELGELYKTIGNPEVEGVNLEDEYVLDEGDYDELDAMITKADSLKNSEDYQNYVNVEEFEKILNEAKEIERDLKSDQQYIIDNITSQLQMAYNALKRVEVDKKDLQDLYDQYLRLDESKYTEESYAVFMKAMANSKVLLESGHITQEEVNEQLQLLQQAYGMLQLVDDSVDNDINDNPTNNISNSLVASNNQTTKTNSMKTDDSANITAWITLMMIPSISYCLIRKRNKSLS